MKLSSRACPNSLLFSDDGPKIIPHQKRFTTPRLRAQLLAFSSLLLAIGVSVFMPVLLFAMALGKVKTL